MLEKRPAISSLEVLLSPALMVTIFLELSMYLNIPCSNMSDVMMWQYY